MMFQEIFLPEQIFIYSLLLVLFVAVGYIYIRQRKMKKTISEIKSTITRLDKLENTQQAMMGHILIIRKFESDINEKLKQLLDRK